jgi:hypothetical protein
VLQAFPDFSPDNIAAFLQERAKDLGPAGPDNAFGAGRLELDEAPVGVEPAETPVSTEAEPTEPPISTEAEPVETPAGEEPTAVAELQPTSTPRPPLEVGLPGQTGLPSQTEADEESSGLSLIIGLGLCLVCLGGLLFLGLLVAGIFFMRRKK